MVTDSSLNSIQIETTNIKTDSDVRNIVQYYDGTLILLTNNTIEDGEGSTTTNGDLVN